MRKSAPVVFVVLCVLIGALGLPWLGRKLEPDPLLGKPAPDFLLPVLQAGSSPRLLRLSDFQGKTVVLDFWASWCKPCHEQIAILERVQRKLDPARALILGVATGEQQQAAERFVEQRGLGYQAVFDTDEQVAAAYGVDSLPTLVIIDREGTVMGVRSGVVTEAALLELIEQTGTD